MSLRLSIVLALLALGACSNQSEGMICSINADNGGNDDCQDGLTCQTITGVTGARCCPPDRNQATTAVCQLNGGSGNFDAAPPSGDDASTDGAMESASDAQHEVGGDASDATTE